MQTRSILISALVVAVLLIGFGGNTDALVRQVGEHDTAPVATREIEARPTPPRAEIQ